jgi:hypothetical protein
VRRMCAYDKERKKLRTKLFVHQFVVAPASCILPGD